MGNTCPRTTVGNETRTHRKTRIRSSHHAYQGKQSTGRVHDHWRHVEGYPQTQDRNPCRIRQDSLRRIESTRHLVEIIIEKLPKKEDLATGGNWNGINMLLVPAKVFRRFLL